jgi:hypothetical protein
VEEEIVEHRDEDTCNLEVAGGLEVVESVTHGDDVEVGFCGCVELRRQNVVWDEQLDSSFEREGVLGLLEECLEADGQEIPNCPDEVIGFIFFDHELREHVDQFSIDLGLQGISSLWQGLHILF